MSMEAARTAVALGAAALDASERIPDNWRTLIDGEMLNILDGQRCVLGQLAQHVEGLPWESYSQVGYAIFADCNWWEVEESHGFMTSADVTHDDLVTAWREALASADTAA